MGLRGRPALWGALALALGSALLLAACSAGKIGTGKATPCSTVAGCPVRSGCWSVRCTNGVCVYTERPEASCGADAVTAGDEGRAWDSAETLGRDPGPGDGGGQDAAGVDAAADVAPEPCQEEGDCDDGNPCTEDRCALDAGGCRHLARPGRECSDDDACTLGDRCGEEGSCVPGTPRPCVDASSCTEDGCDPGTGACVFVQKEVGASCTDLNACTEGDACDALGACVPGAARDCGDGQPCTRDRCVPETGCVHEPRLTEGCEDGDPCTEGDLCGEGGACEPGGARACGDDNPCTDDACDPGSGACTHVALSDMSCDDGNPCTGPDGCASGVCGGPQVCACTEDGDCPAGDPCTGTWRCQPKAAGGTECALVEGSVVVCDTGSDDLCRATVCDPAEGVCKVVPRNEGKACNDGSKCTLNDTCEAAACSGGGTPACDDGDACTADSCDPGQGCVHTLLVPCCGNGDLELGEDCDDGNPSNNDPCLTNCKKAECGDGHVLAGVEACDEGSLNASAPDAPCRPDCTLPTCGDGVVDPSLSEDCDDGSDLGSAGDPCVDCGWAVFEIPTGGQGTELLTVDAARLPDGRLGVVWTQKEGGADVVLRGALLDADLGITANGILLQERVIAGLLQQPGPEIEAVDDSGFLVVAVEGDGLSRPTVQRLDAGGAVGSPRRLSERVSRGARVARHSGGGAVVAWIAEGTAVRVQRVAVSGLPIGALASYPLPSGAVVLGARPALCRDGSGAVVGIVVTGLDESGAGEIDHGSWSPLSAGNTALQRIVGEKSLLPVCVPAESGLLVVWRKGGTANTAGSGTLRATLLALDDPGASLLVVGEKVSPWGPGEYEVLPAGPLLHVAFHQASGPAWRQRLVAPGAPPGESAPLIPEPAADIALLPFAEGFALVLWTPKGGSAIRARVTALPPP